MKRPLTNQTRWILSTILFALSTILFVVSWTSPFWPPDAGWLGLPWVKTIFPIVGSLSFLLLFFICLWILSRTTPLAKINPGKAET